MVLTTTRRRAAVLALAAGLGLAAAGCGRGEQDGSAGAGASGGPATATTQSTAPPARAPAAPTRTAPTPPPAKALPGLPAFTEGFERWDRLNREPIPPDSAQTRRVGVDAHRSTKDVYVSVPRERLRAAGEFPVGAIIVKAGREDGPGGEISLVAVMRKIQGVDPVHGDWKWVEYKRAGTGAAFATDASLTGATCWGCHATAEETDWVFTPLDP